MTQIDRRMNIVVPVDGPDGKPQAYVHSTPISLEVFESNSRVIAAAFSAVFADGLGDLSGPRVAATIIREEAQRLGRWDGPTGVQNSLMNEIRRLSSYVSPGSNGWESIPYQEACDRSIINEWDRSEVDNALCFFTLVSCMHRRGNLESSLNGMAVFWDASITSLTVTDFAHSMKTSTVADSFGEKTVGSSVPL